MGKRKIIGNCKVEGCTRELDSLGLCGLHYRRQYYHGRLHLKYDGKSSHPNRSTWCERKGYGTLPPEWLKDFWQFVKDVGERPSKDHYLTKKDRTKPYGKDNFLWLKHIRRQPEESEKDWKARQWKRRIELTPDINRNRGQFYRLGMSPTEYREIVDRITKEQKDLCAICHKPESAMERKINRPRRLALDHCHKTMKIRGLLCSRCNRAIGMLEESIEVIQSMIKYAKKYIKNPTSIPYTNRNRIFFPRTETDLCEICAKPETRPSQWGKLMRLSVDHCHKTKMIRGLLCARCNTQLGRMEESIPYLQSMITYLKKHKTPLTSSIP